MTEATRFALCHDRFESLDGADTTQLDLVFQSDDSMKIDGVYVGPKAEKVWGDWDHEFWINVPASHAQAFLALIARDAFTREARLTYGTLCELVEKAEIPLEKGHST